MLRCAFRRNRILALAIGAAIASPILTPASLQAADTTWTNATGNTLWADPLNWSTGVPTAADFAQFEIGGVINLPSNAEASQLGAFLPAPLTLQGGQLRATTITALDPDTLFINSPINAIGGFLQLGNVNVNGTIGDGLGGGNFLVSVNRGKLNSTITATGAVTIVDATMDVGASMPNASGVTLGNVVINTDQAAFPSLNRLPDAGGLRIQGGKVTFNGGASGSTAESTGVFQTDRRAALELIGPTGGGSLVLTAQSFTHNAGSTFELSLSSNAQLRFVNPPTSTAFSTPSDRDVTGFGVGTVSDGATNRMTFLTYDTTVGMRPIAWANEHVTSIAASTTFENVRLTGAETVSSDKTIRSLNLAEGTLQLNGSRLNILSSGLIMQGASPNRIGGTGTLHFQNGATVWSTRQFAAAPDMIDVPIEAPEFTKAGNGEVVLTRANAINGNVWITGGTLTVNASGALGAGSVFLNGGDLRSNVDQSIQKIAPGTGRLWTAPGTTLDVAHVDSIFLLSVGGGGTLHVPAGATWSMNNLLINEGELRVDGSLLPAASFASRNVTLSTTQGASKLSGTGFLNGVTASAGIVAPGTSDTAGRLSMNNFAASGFGTRPTTLQLDLDGLLAGDEYDQLRVLQSTSITRMVFDVSVGFDAEVGDTFLVIDNTFTGPITGSFLGLPEGSTFTDDNYGLRVSYIGGDGNDVTLTVVPEPAAAALTVLAIGGFGRRRRVSRVARI